MARREIVEVKRDKAIARVTRFREDYSALRKQYDQVKAVGSAAKANLDRSSLLPSTSASTSSSYSPNPTTSSTAQTSSLSSSLGAPAQRLNRQPSLVPESPFSINMAPSPSSDGSGRWTTNNPPGYDLRTNRALDEHDRFGGINSSLDGFLAQGQAVMGNLANQRDLLKGTQRRLLSAANTLGLSRETITFIERRTKADYYILLGGGAFTLVCFYFILKYFG
ncbi:BQ5605_C002g01535 [Microbotryum silenes-dioicae]|uniref:Protein transport protein BOS1 n=1 Tax=Microbotryum silenes-dioicae TaxID=796604 RepID=A0A2X0MKZ8_9BASI|nr:BQ5605_C002g01535 [Microbotryum silenes-dioicae]